MTARIFEVKRFAVHDGPGIRTTVFFKGCPLSCLWCHNPEGIAYETELALLERKCVHCGECFAACSLGLHTEDENGVHAIDRERCTLCGACVKACMPGALKIYGEQYSAERLFEIAAGDADFYKQSGGGVTCSGGEPLMQPEFLEEFLRMCKGAGLHTAVDTSGCAGWQSFERILPYTDLFLYDIKHMDSDEHKKLTGVENRLILDNLKRLSAHGASVEIRMPIIPGLNDSDDNILQTAKFLQDIKTLTLVRPLPYHALSGSKYASIGRDHQMPAAGGDEYTVARRVAELIKKSGLPCHSPD